MPNNFGGPQNHPSYDPRRKLDRRTEYLLNDVLYTKVNGRIEAQSMDGNTMRFSLIDPALPKQVRRHFTK